MNRHAYAPANRRRREDLKFDSLFSKETTGLLLKDVAHEQTGDNQGNDGLGGLTQGSSALPGSYAGQRKISRKRASGYNTLASSPASPPDLLQAYKASPCTNAAR